MSIRPRHISFSALILLGCLVSSTAGAQIREPGWGRATTPIAEPVTATLDPSSAATRMWNRLAAWSVKPVNNARLRSGLPQPRTTPAPAKAAR